MFVVKQIRSHRNAVLQLSRFADDVDSTPLAIEHYFTVDQSEQCVISTLANTLSRMPLVSNLANQDVAGNDGLAAEFLYTASLSV